MLIVFHGGGAVIPTTLEGTAVKDAHDQRASSRNETRCRTLLPRCQIIGCRCDEYPHEHRLSVLMKLATIGGEPSIVGAILW